MTVGVTCALAMVSQVINALRVASVALLCQRNETLRSAPSTPRTRAASPFSGSSGVPLSNCTSTPAPVASTATDAMPASGPLKAIWFQGSARMIFATTSSLNLYLPARAATSRYCLSLRTMRNPGGRLAGITATSPSNSVTEDSFLPMDSASMSTRNFASLSVSLPS